MRLAGPALQALAAGHVHLGGNEVAFLDAGDFIAEGRHFTAELMAGDERRMNAVLRPPVPVVDVQIGAADGGDFYLDQNISAAECGNLDVANFRARGGLRLDDRQHGGWHEEYLIGSRTNTKRLILALWAIHLSRGTPFSSLCAMVLCCLNSSDFPRGMLSVFHSLERRCFARNTIWPMCCA